MAALSGLNLSHPAAFVAILLIHGGKGKPVVILAEAGIQDRRQRFSFLDPDTSRRRLMPIIKSGMTRC